MNLLILGTSFYQEDAPFEKRSVYDVVEGLELIQKLKPKKTGFTHLGHGVDRQKSAPGGACYAFDGFTLALAND